MVNQQVAALAAHYAYRFLVRRELTQMATTFSLEPPVSKSYLLTKQRIAACDRGKDCQGADESVSASSRQR